MSMETPQSQPAQKALGSSGRKRERARARETRVSPSRAPFFSCAHYFQAPATQATTKSPIYNYTLLINQ